MIRFACVLTLIGAVTSPLDAQGRRGGWDDDFEQFNVPYDGSFTFVRLRFAPLSDFGSRRFRRDLKWDHDYPRAERHLATMMEELTTAQPNQIGTNILAADDPEIFKYPVAYVSEPGFWSVNEDEAEGLRNYLLKGGFLIFDDFQGGQWYNFEEKIGVVLPEARLVELDASHPIFHSFFEIETLDDFIHPLSRVSSVFYGIFEDNDPEKRLMVIVNYNNDIGESWEWSDSGWIPIDITNEAYKLGINYIVYAMTH